MWSFYLLALFPLLAETDASDVNLVLENLGTIFTSSGSVIPPTHVFRTNYQNLLVGTQIISFDEDGSITHTANLDSLSVANVASVDSHKISSKGPTYIAVAQDSQIGPGSVVSVYLVSVDDAYSSYAKWRTKVPVTVAKLYSDGDGVLMLAVGQRSFPCSDEISPECGLSS